MIRVIKQYKRIILVRDDNNSHLPIFSLWKWGFNFNEGYIALPKIPFTIFFGTSGGGVFLYTSLFGKELIGTWLLKKRLGVKIAGYLFRLARQIGGRHFERRFIIFGGQDSTVFPRIWQHKTPDGHTALAIRLGDGTEIRALPMMASTGRIYDYKLSKREIRGITHMFNGFLWRLFHQWEK